MTGLTGFTRLDNGEDGRRVLLKNSAALFYTLTSSKTKGAHLFGLWCALLGFELVEGVFFGGCVDAV